MILAKVARVKREVLKIAVDHAVQHVAMDPAEVTTAQQARCSDSGPENVAVQQP